MECNECKWKQNGRSKGLEQEEEGDQETQGDGDFKRV